MCSRPGKVSRNLTRTTRVVPVFVGSSVAGVLPVRHDAWGQGIGEKCRVAAAAATLCPCAAGILCTRGEACMLIRPALGGIGQGIGGSASTAPLPAECYCRYSAGNACPRRHYFPPLIGCKGIFHPPLTDLPSQTPFTQWNSEVVMEALPPAKSFADIFGNLGKCILGMAMLMSPNPPMPGICAQVSIRTAGPQLTSRSAWWSSETLGLSDARAQAHANTD